MAKVRDRPRRAHVGLANAYATHDAVGVGVPVVMLTLLLWVLGFTRGLLR
jgi:hypothetical protein